MTLGKLRDQIIYPHTQQDVRRKGMSDNDLEKILEKVKSSADSMKLDMCTYP